MAAMKQGIQWEHATLGSVLKNEILRAEVRRRTEIIEQGGMPKRDSREEAELPTQLSMGFQAGIITAEEMRAIEEIHFDPTLKYILGRKVQELAARGESKETQGITITSRSQIEALKLGDAPESVVELVESYLRAAKRAAITLHSPGSLASPNNIRAGTVARLIEDYERTRNTTFAINLCAPDHQIALGELAEKLTGLIAADSQLRLAIEALVASPARNRT